MRVLIISDTHRRDDRFLELIKRVKPIDMLIHCGDSEGSEDLYLEYAGCPVEIVSGIMIFLRICPGRRNSSWENIRCGLRMDTTIMYPWGIPC